MAQGRSAIATAAAGNAAAVAAPKFGLLARMQGLAGGAGIGGLLGKIGAGAGAVGGAAVTSGAVGVGGAALIGTGVGLAGYEGLHRAGLVETGAEEGSANASGRLMHWGQEGAGWLGYDALVEKEKRGNAAEASAMSLFAKMRAGGGKLPAGRTSAAFSSSAALAGRYTTSGNFPIPTSGMGVDNRPSTRKDGLDWHWEQDTDGVWREYGDAKQFQAMKARGAAQQAQAGRGILGAMGAMAGMFGGSGTKNKGGRRGPLSVNEDLNAYVMRESNIGNGQIELILGFKPLRVVVTDGPGRTLQNNIAALPLAPG